MTTTPTLPVEQLIADLDAAGFAREDGVFTLDREKAREKMRQFQLADPHRYVLELVQAAVRRGATRLRFDIDADDMRLRFDGRPFALQDFEILYNAMFTKVSRPEAEAVRQLALGLNAAMALNPRWIRVWSGQGGEGAYLEMRPGADDRFEAAKGVEDGTLIHVKGRFRPGLAVTFFQNLKGTLPEEGLLRERCEFARAEIDLEGKILSHGLTLPNLVGEVAFDHGDVAGVVGWRPDAATDAVVHLVRDGVWIASHPIKGVAKGLVALVDSAGFRKDVSQADIVQDAAYEAARDHLKAATKDSIARIARELREAWDHQEKPAFPLAWAVGLCRRTLGALSLEALGTAPADTLGYHLARVPLWTTLTGDRVDTATLFAELKRSSRVSHTTWAFDQHPGDPELSAAALVEDDLVLRPDAEAQEELRRLLGKRLVSVTKRLETRREGVKNKRLWQSRPTAPRLEAVTDATAILVAQPFSGPNATGELGLWRKPGTPSVVFFVKEGHALCRAEVTTPLPGLVLVLEAPFQATVRWDNVKRDSAYVAAVTEALEALPALFEAAASSTDRFPDLRRRRAALVLAWITALGQEAFGPQLFKALGVAEGRQPADLDARVAAWREALVVDPTADAPPGAVARLPVFEGLDGQWRSLADLWEERAKGQPLRWVPRDLPPLPAMAEPVLRLTTEARDALETWFGADAFDEMREEYEQQFAEAEFQAKPTEPLTLGGADRPAGPWRIRFSGADGLAGEVAVTYPETTARTIPWPVRFLRGGRRLAERDLDFGVLSGAAVVNDDAFTPDGEWDDVVEDAAYQRARAAIFRASAALVGHLADHRDHLAPLLGPSVTALLRLALDAWVPTRNFGRALLALRQAHGSPEAADRAYQELVELLATMELVFVDRALAEVLDAQALPTREAVVALLPGPAAPPPAPELALALSGGADRFVGQPRALDAGRCPFSALREAALFRDDETSPCSLEDALQDFAARGEVLVLSEPAAREDVPELRIFLAADPDDRVLRYVFGNEALVDGTPFVEAARQRRRFATQREVEQPSLPEGAVLAKVAVEDPGRQGEVGLAARPEPGAWLHLYTQHRRLCSVEGFSRFGLVAIVNDDHVSPQESFSDVARDAAYDALVEACEAAVPGLVDRALDHWQIFSTDQRAVALLHALDWFARPSLPTLLEQAQAPEPLLARWLDLRALPGPGDRLLSLRELVTACEAHGELAYLPEPLPGVVRDPGRAVIFATGSLLRRLRALFPKVTSYHRQWEADQLVAGLQARGATPVPDADAVPALARVAVAMGRLRGQLHLPEDERDPLVVRFGAFGFEVAQTTTGPLYPCAGIFVVPDDLAQERSGQPLLGVEQEVLLREARVLYRRLVSRFPGTGQGSTLQQRLRAVLRGLLDRLLAAKAGGGLTTKDTKLLNQLTYLPLLPAEGGHVNLAVARERRPPELEGLGYWTEETPSPFPRVAEPPRDPAAPAATSPQVEVPVVDLQADDDAGEDAGGEDAEEPAAPVKNRRSAAPLAPAPEPAPEPEAPPPPPPEDVLLAALRTELGAISITGSAVMRHVNLRALKFEPRRGDAAVTCTAQGIFLNPKHPLVAAALEEGPADPVLVSYLASALYTAVNIHLEEITDQDEAAFHALAVERVERVLAESSATPAPRPKP